MTNVVLYRKYRPQVFSDVVGQEHVVQTLTNAVANNMISHAYLFAGPRGSGKTTLARLFAKAVNCENLKGFEPCNKCNSCVEINHGNAMDLLEIDAASNRGIDEMRELREGIRFVPTKLNYKVFIIDESHQLTKEAANALLKTLEEPPEHAIFILATTEIHKMIPTIISRCQRFDFRKLTLLEIIGQLGKIAKEEKVKISKEALDLIALNSQGAMRDAIGMLDQAITFCTSEEDREITVEEIKNLLGLVEMNVIGKFVEFLKNKNSSEAIKYLNEIFEKGLDMEVFARALINYLRQILILKISLTDANQPISNPVLTVLTKDELKMIQNQATGFSEEDIQKTIKLFLEAVNKMKYSPIPQLQIELATIESVGFGETK